MFLNKPGKPTQAKKAVYLLAATLLGVLLSFIAHAAIEIKYLQWLASRGQYATFYGGCALPPALRLLILSIGLFGGLALGEFWWRKVYIERKWRGK